MSRIFLFLLMILVLALSVQACVPGQPTPDLNTISTAVAQTLSASTLTAGPGVPVTGNQSPTPTATLLTDATPTPTAAVPTDTQIPSPTALVLSTPMLTPGVVQVYVSVPTNCRLGPSVSYTRVGGLQLGQVANVVGRNATGDYWIIINPSRASETCWLWGRYATVVGDTSSLPVFSPPPLPTPVPGFDASLNALESCADTGWWLDIALENTGSITFRSLFLTVTDTVTGSELSLYQENFIDRDGCDQGEDLGDLDPDDILIISSPTFTYDPSDHRVRTRITLCSDAGQSGTCMTRSFDFTP